MVAVPIFYFIKKVATQFTVAIFLRAQGRAEEK